MSNIASGDRIYSPTCLYIEASLKKRAKKAGINMSRTLREALEVKLEENEGERGCNAPTSDPSRNPDTHAVEASR